MAVTLRLSESGVFVALRLSSESFLSVTSLDCRGFSAQLLPLSHVIFRLQHIVLRDIEATPALLLGSGDAGGCCERGRLTKSLAYLILCSQKSQKNM